MPTSVIAAIGIGVGLFGAVKSMSASKDMASAQQAQIAQEQAAERQRQQQMELEYQRQQKQVVRNMQRARAMSLSTATAQGASKGSVLEGAYGGIQGQGDNQLLASSQNHEIGENLFGIDAQISQSRIAYSQAQSRYQEGAALSSLGGSLVSNAGMFSRVGQSSFAALGRGMSFGTGPGSFGMGNRYS